MKYIVVLLLCLFFTNQIAFGDENTKEEAYIEIISGNLDNDFYMIYFDYNDNKPYLGLESLLNFLELDDLKVNLKSKKLEGKYIGQNEKNITVDDDLDFKDEFIKDDDIYISLDDLKKIFPIENITWDSDGLKLILDFKFKLPSQLRSEAENRIRTLENKNKSKEEINADIIMKHKMISSGILKFEYNKQDIEKKEYNLNLAYGSQLFYGDFKISQEIKPESKLNYINLEYNDFLKKNNRLVLGDSYLQLDDYTDIERNIRGFSISKSNLYTYTNNNETIIQGEAYNANLVELLQNGNLIDYKRISGKQNFSFKVSNLSNFTTYIIKVYYNNGKIETREVSILSTNDILKKGNSNYILQGGQSNENHYGQQNYNYLYGITDDLTLGGGFIQGKNSDGVKNEYITSRAIYRTPLKIIPTVIDGKIIYDSKQDLYNYIFKLNQKFLDTTLFFQYDELNGSIMKNKGYEKYYNLGLSRGFGKISVALGKENKKYEGNVDNNYYLNFEYNTFSNISLFLENSYEKDNQGLEKYKMDFKSSYSGFSYLYTIFEMKYEKEKDAPGDREYSLRITKKNNDDHKYNNFDFGITLKYDTVEKFTYGIDFTYRFDGDSIYIETPFNRDEDKNTMGLNVEKSFLLKEPLRKINTKNIDDMWIEGTVFLDENGNGIQDKNEQGLPDVEVNIGTERRNTDKYGKYIIGNLSSKELQTVEINGETIDAMMKPEKENIIVKGVASSGVTVNIPIAAVSVITGNIQINEALSDEEFLKLLSKTEIILLKNNKIIKKVFPEFDGYYYLEDVLPGEYQLKVDYKGNLPVKLLNSEKNIKIDSDLEGKDYEENNFKFDVKNLITNEK